MTLEMGFFHLGTQRDGGSPTHGDLECETLLPWPVSSVKKETIPLPRIREKHRINCLSRNIALLAGHIHSTRKQNRY